MHSQHRKNLTRSIRECQEVSDTLRHGKLYSTVGYVMRMADAEPTTKTCQFILGNPTKADYRKYGADERPPYKCNDPTIPHSPYCEHHHQICYVPKPLTEDEEGPA